MMGRPRKNDSALLVELTVKFFETEANGNMARMKFTKISEYARRQGYDLQEQHFRRCREVQDKLDELQRLADNRGSEDIVAAYRNLDVEALLARSRSLEDLKNNIAGLDGYWREVYRRSEELAKDNQRLMLRPTFEREVRDLEGRNAALSAAIHSLEREKRALLAENVYLKGMLKKYLYPAVAETILRKDGLSKKEKPEEVRGDQIEQMIDDGVPAAYTGKAHPAPEKETRMERLMKQMERMVDEE